MPGMGLSESNFHLGMASNLQPLPIWESVDIRGSVSPVASITNCTSPYGATGHWPRLGLTRAPQCGALTEYGTQLWHFNGILNAFITFFLKGIDTCAVL